MWAALDNPWLSRAGNLVFLVGALQTAARLVMGLSLNMVGVVLLGLGVALIATFRFSEKLNRELLKRDRV